MRGASSKVDKEKKHYQGLPEDVGLYTKCEPSMNSVGSFVLGAYAVLVAVDLSAAPRYNMAILSRV